MHIKFLSLLTLILMLNASGCMDQNNETVLPKPQPLVQNFSTFKPPAEITENVEILKDTELTGIITLRKALTAALINNPELKAFSWEVRASQARKLQAGLWPNPELEIEIEEVAGPGDRSGFDTAETTIALSQLIELAGKGNKRVKIASLESKLAGWDYEAKKLDVFTDTTKAFIAVLAAQDQLKVTKEILQLSEESVNTVTKRVDAGKDPPLEKTKAAVAYSNIQIQYHKTVQNLESVRSKLASNWGGQTADFETATGKLDSLTDIPAIEQLINLLDQNPDIARWALQLDRSRAVIELEKARSFSDITLRGGVQRFNETNENALVFGISIGLPISDRNQGGKREAAYNLAKTMEEQRAAYIRIRMELVEAYQKLSNSHTEAYQINENILQGAESVFQASKTGYSMGKLDYLHVLDAQRTLFEAKTQYITALASFHLAKTDIERLIGRSVEDIDISENEDSK